MISDKCFIEVDCYQNCKWGKNAVGDVFLSQKSDRDSRMMCVLADGLGSGIKANVLATMTATMALKYVSSNIDMRNASEIIMATLPVCSERRIGYSTFTIFDVDESGLVRAIEYENPSYVLLRGGTRVPVAKRGMTVHSDALGERSVYYSTFEAHEGDRIIAYTDGIVQSGIGTREFPLGWTSGAAETYAETAVRYNPGISARDLARKMVGKALANDRNRAKDDISCAVINFRQPRRLLVLTGPSIDKANDPKIAAMIRDYNGRKVICGGTTASIVAREWGGLPIHVDLGFIDPEIPPPSSMEGVDLVTEGTLTLSRTARMLEAGTDPENIPANAATRLLKLFLESDIISFVVGTKINDAHQDPNLPVELDIRRNLIKGLAAMLKDKYLKETDIRYI